MTKLMKFVGLIERLGGNCVSRHGIRQFRTPYADGPAYITQCPIQSGGSYVYEFTVDNQSGTFFYHAHITWLRATVHGALIVHPKKGLPSSYGAIEEEIPVVIGRRFLTSSFIVTCRSSMGNLLWIECHVTCTCVWLCNGFLEIIVVITFHFFRRVVWNTSKCVRSRFPRYGNSCRVCNHHNTYRQWLPRTLI